MWALKDRYVTSPKNRPRNKPLDKKVGKLVLRDFSMVNIEGPQNLTTKSVDFR